MSGQVVVFADPERRLVDAVVAVLEADDPPAFLLDANGDPASCSVDYPDGTTAAPSVPHFQVRHDGTPDPGRYVERSTIGVTAWYPPNRETDAKNAMSWVAGHLAAGGWSTSPSSGRLPGRDPATGLYFVATEWRVRLKGTSVA